MILWPIAKVNVTGRGQNMVEVATFHFTIPNTDLQVFIVLPHCYVGLAKDVLSGCVEKQMHTHSNMHIHTRTHLHAQSARKVSEGTSKLSLHLTGWYLKPHI